MMLKGFGRKRLRTNLGTVWCIFLKVLNQTMITTIRIAPLGVVNPGPPEYDAGVPPAELDIGSRPYFLRNRDVCAKVVYLRWKRGYFAELCSDLPSFSWPAARSFLPEVFPARGAEAKMLPSASSLIPASTKHRNNVTSLTEAQRLCKCSPWWHSALLDSFSTSVRVRGLSEPLI